MRATVVACLTCLAVSPLAAQAGFIPCVGQRIDTVIIRTEAPTVTGLRRVPLAGQLVRRTHVVTRDDIIRGFLLLRQGDRCLELRRAESERILRAQPFLADASVEVQPGTARGVTLMVRTIDDVSLILSGSAGASSPNVRAIRVGSSNLAGVGITTSFAWKHEPAFDDYVQGRVIDHQFAGRHYVLDLETTRHALGLDDHAQLLLPFRTDLQRFAWRIIGGRSRGHARFEERDTGRVALGFERSYFESGAILRVGPPGRLTLLGLSFTNERADPDADPVRLSEAGFAPDTAAALAGRFTSTRAARVNALLGIRGIRFRRMRAIDALRGTQDIPVGLQIGTLVGRGVPALASNSNDLFLATDIYAGFGTARTVFRAQLQGEGRRVTSAGSGPWDALVGSGRVSWHGRVTERRTRVLSVEYSGTERSPIPHSLSLGSSEGGVRGFAGATEFGGRRGVARIEERIFLGTPFDYADAGIAFFADGGQLWPGDVPYARPTPVRGAAGVSLLVAVPMRSTRLWRLDVAVPFNPERGGRTWEVRLKHSDLTTFFWREPADIRSARARGVPSSVYSWP